MRNIIVEKYQHYMNEAVKLQQIVNEQESYIQELEEAFETISEIFDSPEGQQALVRYRNKAADRLAQARKDKEELKAAAERHKEKLSGPGWGGPGPRGSWPNQDNPRIETDKVSDEAGRDTEDTMATLRSKAKEAQRQITQRKKGLGASKKYVERNKAEDEARLDAEAKAKGMDRDSPYYKSPISGQLLDNPYWKPKKIDRDEIKPNF